MANNHEQPYDPYIPSGRGTPGPSAQHADNDRTAALQAQIDDTVNVMRQNIQRTEERQGNVDNIDHKTKGLSESAAQFQRGTNKVRKRLWWKNARTLGWIFLGVAIGIVILALGSRTQIVRNPF
ncbi:MAG: hypothetical protein LQ341_006421 [Variospora aurantia]|nr:MAG: hypothetical protein LQ341_006421 [Variospora aurantia]